MEALQKKVNFLERENETLKEKTDNFLTDTDHFVNKEELLVRELMKELSVARTSSSHLQLEVANQLEVLHQQDDKILFLETELAAVRNTVKRLIEENNGLALVIDNAKETERLISAKLTEAMEKLNEMEICFEEKCRELNEVNLRSISDDTFFHYSCNTESILSELRNSICKDPDDPDGKAIRLRQSQQDNAISTIRCVRRLRQINQGHHSNEIDSSYDSIFLDNSDSGENEEQAKGLTNSNSQSDIRGIGGDSIRPRRSSLSSDFSTESCSFSFSGISNIFKYPEKLKLIKPIEGK